MRHKFTGNIIILLFIFPQKMILNMIMGLSVRSLPNRLAMTANVNSGQKHLWKTTMLHV